MKLPVHTSLGKLALFLVGNFLIVHFVTIFLFATPWRETSLFDTFVFFFRIANLSSHFPEEQGADSWNPMIRALDYAETSPREGLYTMVFFEENVKFQYPPPSLIPVNILRGFLDSGQTVFTLNTISLLLLIWTAVLVARIYETQYQPDPPDSSFTFVDRTALYILSLFAVITFYPVIVAFRLGQVQVWITSLLAWMLLSMLRGKERTAGILAGIVALIKPQYGLLLIWALLRKRWKFATTFIVVVVAGMAISVLTFPLSDHIDYLRVLSFLAAHGESYYHNQSVNGLLNRLLQNGEILTFQKHQFPPYHPVVFWGTVVSSLLFLYAALCRKKGNRAEIADVCFAIVAFTMASPVAWQHHYGILLPVYAALFPLLQPNDKPALLALGLAYVLTSNYFVMAGLMAQAPFGLNVFLSYLFAGSLLTLGILRSRLERNLYESA